MKKVEITHTVDDETRKTTVVGPDFVDVLLEVNEVSVDGQVFTDVEKVSYYE